MTHLLFGLGCIFLALAVAYFYTQYMQGKDHDGRR